jgi:hypothetical protein
VVGWVRCAVCRYAKDPDGDALTPRLRYVAYVRAAGYGMQGGESEGGAGAGGPIAIRREALMDTRMYEVGLYFSLPMRLKVPGFNP